MVRALTQYAWHAKSQSAATFCQGAMCFFFATKPSLMLCPHPFTNSKLLIPCTGCCFSTSITLLCKQINKKIQLGYLFHFHIRPQILCFQNIGPWNWGTDFLVRRNTFSMDFLFALNTITWVYLLLLIPWHEFSCCSKYHSMNILVALNTLSMGFLVALITHSMELLTDPV